MPRVSARRARRAPDSPATAGKCRQPWGRPPWIRGLAAVQVERRPLYAPIRPGHPCTPIETGESPAVDSVRRTRRRGSGWTIGARTLPGGRPPGAWPRGPAGCWWRSCCPRRLRSRRRAADARTAATTRTTKLLDCVTVEGVREHQAGAPGDRGEERRRGLPRHPRRRHRGLRGQRRVRRRSAREGRLRGDARRARVRRSTSPRCCGSSRRSRRSYETGAFTGSGSGDRRGQRHPDRHQPGEGRPARLDQWLRARGLRRLRLERPGRHRARAARYLLLRDEGLLRRAGRRRGGRSSSTRATPPTARSCSSPTPRASTSRSRAHPGRSPTASPWSARASPTDSRWPRRARRRS